MLKSLFIALSLLTSPIAAVAATTPNQWAIDEQYYSVGSMEIHEVDLTTADMVEVFNANQESRNFSSPKEKELDLGQIINIGKQVWKIIVDNKPVVDVQLQRANAVPSGVTDGFQMENWQDPVAKKYEVVYKNLYGGTVVRFNFLVTYAYNGQVNGKGRYLSEVGFVPSTVTVVWMYNFNVSAEVVRTINVGTSSDPVGAIEINLNWVVKTPLKEDRRTNNFYIRGDGGYRAL